ncbi:WD repeat-containing protein 76 isoform X2 [Thalassophryne amazonica]|uniref:WD repeat-containing protein 76 isoform X2 n=1 Tax=Thalassophryne amazonica TaxID=390379 RepID=UPI0014723F4D|nr:WD repeat-containing protein 76 isoform X2 [Thalassophryne amazonica]
MSTTRTKNTREEAEKVRLATDVTPLTLKEAVRRSERPTRKRLIFSPEENLVKTSKKSRRTKTVHTNTLKKSKVEKQEDSDIENSDVECASDVNGGLSAYELERLENIRQNQAFLSAINLYQATETLRESTRPKPSQRGLMRSKAAPKDVLPSRKSLRLQNKEAEIPPSLQDLRASLPDEETLRFSKKPPGPLPVVPLNVEEGSRLPSELIELCAQVSVEQERAKLNQKEYCAVLKTMKITEAKVAKVVKDRITCAAFNPCTSSLLMAAGDKFGKLGLWNLGSDWGDDGVLLFEPHSRAVGCMAFSNANPVHLLSLSYDGSVRCMDVEKAVFEDVYDMNDDAKTFDFMTHDCMTLVVGSWSGLVAIVDRRTPGNSQESLHILDPKCVRCVSVHPVQKHYFAAAENRVVSIYDSRCLKKTQNKAVSQLHGHSLSISSAYFSPWTGNSVLTSCMDDKIRLYDTSVMTADTPLLTSISHNMHTGRWLSKLSAVWDPKQEDSFVVGSMARPRTVQVFHESGKLQHSFRDNKHLTTVLSITAFHPTRNALLGGNASGRLHVFSD